MFDEETAPFPSVDSLKRDRTSISVFDSSDALPENDNDSDYVDNQYPDNSGNYEPPPKRLKYRNPIKGELREQPCRGCVIRMADKGPGYFCRSQDSPVAVACYDCARTGSKCSPTPHNAIALGHHLQEAALRIANNHITEVVNWDRLAQEAKKAIRSANASMAPPLSLPVPPKVATSSTASDPSVPQPQLSSLELALGRMLESLETNNRLLRQVLANENENTNRLVNSNRENGARLDNTNRLLRRIVDEIGASNTGTVAGLPPFE
ncbi:hypothetical protein FSARC_7876 [Fusarium sarcochroum]|uniref:Uncharacterized protein n=1 Tax=Fusarium sarcochroum TaxID=1208366 RepID=A0A8H4TUI6_9HYPO|nr:hypothetical protein FSARC_7876 [Fusarium sarcochroum]